MFFRSVIEGGRGSQSRILGERTQRTSEDSKELQRIPKNFRGFRRTSEDPEELQRIPKNFRGSRRTSEDPEELQRIPKNFRGFPKDPSRTNRVS
jgi:hypothetical protein